MIKIHCITLLLIVLGLNSRAQGWLPMGARSNSLANASVTLVDAWSFHHNPGALGELKQASGGLAYENRFLLKELQSQGLVYAHPLKVGVVSVGAQFYGYRQFRTQRIGAGYSLKLAERFFAGVQLNYQGLQLNENYGSNHSVSAEAGVQAVITDNWRIGVSAFNIGRAKLSDFEDDRYNTVMRFGTNYSFSEKVVILAEAEKNLEHPVNFKGGVEYQAVKNFFVRAGAASRATEFTFGFGYKWKILQLDLGSGYQQQLGWSPCFSLTYCAASKNE